VWFHPNPFSRVLYSDVYVLLQRLLECPVRVQFSPLVPHLVHVYLKQPLVELCEESPLTWWRYKSIDDFRGAIDSETPKRPVLHVLAHTLCWLGEKNQDTRHHPKGDNDGSGQQEKADDAHGDVNESAHKAVREHAGARNEETEHKKEKKEFRHEGDIDQAIATTRDAPMLAIAQKNAQIHLQAIRVHTAQNCIYAAPTFVDASEEKMEALFQAEVTPTTETEVQTLDQVKEDALEEKEDALDCTTQTCQDVPEASATASATDVHSADNR